MSSFLGAGGSGGRKRLTDNPAGIYISIISFAPVGTYNVNSGTYNQGAFLTPGSGYPNGVYSNVPLTGGSGSGQKANVYVDFGFNITNQGTGYFTATGYLNVTGGTGAGGIVAPTIDGGGAITALRWVERGSTPYAAGDVISVNGGGINFSATLTTNGGGVSFVQPINSAGSGYAVGDDLSASNANLGGAGSGFSAHIYAIGNDTTGDGTEAKPYATLQVAYAALTSNDDTINASGSVILQLIDGFYTETTQGSWLNTSMAGAWVGSALVNIQGNTVCRTCVQGNHNLTFSNGIVLPNEVFVFSLGMKRGQQFSLGLVDFDNCDVGIGGTTQEFWICQGFGANIGVHGDVTIYNNATVTAMFTQQGGFANFGPNSIIANGSRTIPTFVTALEHSYQTSGGIFTVTGSLTVTNQVNIDDMGRIDVSFAGLGLNAYPGTNFGTVKNGGAYIYSGAGGRRCLIGSDSETVKTLFTPDVPLTLVNGLNSNIDISAGGSYCRVSGPTGAFSVGGFIPSTQVPVVDGSILRIYNSTAQAMTVVNEDASSTAANRIKTLTGANIVLSAGTSAVHFIYDGTDIRWIFMGAGVVGGGGSPAGTDTMVQYNATGAFGAQSNFEWDYAGKIMKLTNTNLVKLDAGNNLVTSGGTEIVLEQTGDALGTTRVHIQNRNGLNGALFENATIDLVDFGMKTSTGAQAVYRLEHRASYLLSANNSTGELHGLVDVQGTARIAFAFGDTDIVLGYGTQTSIGGEPGIKGNIILQPDQFSQVWFKNNGLALADTVWAVSSGVNGHIRLEQRGGSVRLSGNTNGEYEFSLNGDPSAGQIRAVIGDVAHAFYDSSATIQLDWNNANSNKWTFNSPFVSKGYTVATLPAGIKGARAHVTDALGPAFLTAVVGGGTVTTPVFYDGTNWVGG